MVVSGAGTSVMVLELVGGGANGAGVCCGWCWFVMVLIVLISASVWRCL